MPQRRAIRINRRHGLNLAIMRDVGAGANTYLQDATFSGAHGPVTPSAQTHHFKGSKEWIVQCSRKLTHVWFRPGRFLPLRYATGCSAKTFQVLPHHTK